MTTNSFKTEPIPSIDIYFFVALRPNAGQGLLILEVSRSHITIYHSL